MRCNPQALLQEAAWFDPPMHCNTQAQLRKAVSWTEHKGTAAPDPPCQIHPAPQAHPWMMRQAPQACLNQRMRCIRHCKTAAM
eukprot:scaffold34170_cov18-Tisochrysis_lutea.AAC.3